MSKKRVLIADDDELVCAIIKKIAERNGADVVTANTGKDALSILEAGQTFHLVFLDLLMPHYTGWDLLDFMERLPWMAGVPVVIVSGAPVSCQEQEKLSKKIAAFVDKETFSIAKFEGLVQDLLAK